MSSNTERAPSTSSPQATVQTIALPPPPSPFLPELPARPAPVRQGNAFARLFSRRSAHNEDIEIADINQPHIIRSRLHVEERPTESRLQRDVVSWSLKMALIMAIVIGFWVWVMLWSLGQFEK